MSLLGDLGTAIKNKLGGTSVDNTVPRYNGTTCTLQTSGVTISDTNIVTASGGFVGNLTGNASTATSATTSASTTGNAATATKLQTARTIGGVSFDGTANINLAGVNIAGNQNTTGNAATATKLQTARSIALAGDVTGSATFDGSANISITATVVDDSHNHTIANVDNLQTSLNNKANLASPALTGTPTAPTAGVGTNTTQIATTAFVQANKPTINASSVGTATAGLAVGSVGSYAFMYLNTDMNTLAEGSTTAGSNLRYTDTYSYQNTIPSGTWRIMGRLKPSERTLCLRIS